MGETIIGFPVPTNVPPQLVLYHRITPPVPRVAPLAVSVVVCPLQIKFNDAVTEPGAVDAVFTVTVRDAHPVVLQVPDARTK